MRFAFYIVPVANQDNRSRLASSMPVYRLLLEYDGGRFHGWQTQPGHPTVQDALERALATICGQSVAVVGSGRTDAGVHARGQVAHFQIANALDPYRLRRSLNGVLDGGVAVLGATLASDDFHARYDARRRRYRYFVSTEPRVLDRNTRVYARPAPDFDLMNEAVMSLVGKHDFDAFCRARSETTNRTCTVFAAHWYSEARQGDWYFDIIADRFLHGMVRAIVGTLLEVGQNKRNREQVREILASRDRRRAGPAAPARGLVLESVEYEEG